MKTPSQWLQGTGVAVITPFTEDKRVDFQALERLLHFLLRAGVDFIVALGTTAETPTLRAEEKRDILLLSREVCDRYQKPLVGGWGGNHTRDLLARLERLPYDRCDGLLSVTPYYNKPNARGLAAHFTMLADQAPAPIILYNVPGRTGLNMAVSTIIELAQHPNIAAIKEASGDIAKQLELCRRAPADFLVLSGDDALALPQMAMGMDGIISVVANAYPSLFSKIVRDGRAGRLEEARRLHYDLLPMIDALFEEGNPTGIKALLAEMGMIANELRLPLVSASAALQEKVKQLHAQLQSLRPSTTP